MDFGKILEAFGASTKVAAPVAIFTLVLLVLNDRHQELAGRLGVAEIVQQHNGTIFLIGLAAWVMLLVAVVRWMYGLLVNKIENIKETQMQKHLLSTLSMREKEFLRTYIDQDTDTRYANVSDGVVGGLTAKTIVFRSSNLGVPGTLQEFPYNLQPWAKYY